ncbi:MAG: hypothetical protein IPG50_21805 [Myxococcales bacterium]|nr:hypothetical protein [Myxococcales bacterium]
MHDEERAARAVLNHIGAGGPFLEEARKIGLEAIRRVLRVKVRRGRPPRRSGALDGVPSAAGEIERAIIEVMAERLEMPRTTPAALRVEKSRRLKKR